MKAYIRLFVAVSLVLVGIGAYLWHDPVARELVLNALAVVVGFLFTPFILESSFFIMGCFILAFFLQAQRAREGDEWVEIPQDNKSEE